MHALWVVLLKQLATIAALLLFKLLIDDTDVCYGVLGPQMVWRLPALKLFTRRSRWSSRGLQLSGRQLIEAVILSLRGAIDVWILWDLVDCRLGLYLQSTIGLLSFFLDWVDLNARYSVTENLQHRRLIRLMHLPQLVLLMLLLLLQLLLLNKGLLQANGPLVEHGRIDDLLRAALLLSWGTTSLRLLKQLLLLFVFRAWTGCFLK